MAKDSFDPRFDAAFQPGFEAPVAPAAAAPRRSPAQVALEQRTEARVPVLDDSADAASLDQVSTSRRPNPFLIALGAISVLLIAGGLGAVQSVKGVFTSENISVDLDYISLNMLIFAAPLAIALGVATGIGVIFLYAIDYKKRHGG